MQLCMIFVSLQDHNAHGPEFLKHMHRLNTLTGANITASLHMTLLLLFDLYTYLILCAVVFAMLSICILYLSLAVYDIMGSV